MGFVIFGMVFFLTFLGISKASTQEAIPNDQLQGLGLSAQSLEKAISAEQANLEQSESWLQDVQNLENALNAELNAYKIQLSAYNNLLLIPTTPLDDLEKVRDSYRVIIANVTQQLKELAPKYDVITQLRSQTDEQYTLNQSQLMDMQVSPLQDASTQKLLEQLQRLIQVFADKRKLLDKIQVLYTAQIDRLQTINQDFATLSTKVDQQIEEKKIQALFQRQAPPLTLSGWEQLRTDFNKLTIWWHSFISGVFWSETFRTLWKSSSFLFFAFILLFGITQMLLMRVRPFFINLESKPFWSQYPWRRLTLQLFHSSLSLIGTTVFLYVYAQVRLIYTTAPLIQVSVSILLIWLSSRWVLDFWDLWNARHGEPLPLPITTYVRILVLGSRVFGIGYVIGEWILGSSSIILLLGRILFEMGLFLWSIFFGKVLRENPIQVVQAISKSQSILKSLVIGLWYTLVSGGLLLELAGYGQLARYWYASWGQSSLILLWGGLLFLILHEWNQTFQRAASPDQPELSKTAYYTAQWLIIRICWLLWAGMLLIGLLLVWGAKQIVLVSLFQVLNYPLLIGGFRISLLGILYAFLILSVTYAAAQLWRHILKKRLLVNSGLDLGLQESITTISVYLLWTFGILAALRAIGLSATSLALALGALGIGLGFGLQNIFNNFISGIILLIERPIIVGDVVEINGIWGNVSKINVRSTLIQTFDNAALIIPNSELISNKVINWSFKDPRMRRTITVGVAYGSDVKLVQRTLLEIADAHPRVLKKPVPVVQFADFGESALMFKLLVWTFLEHGGTVENDIRFEIDRLFRERQITIAFPQLEVHMKS